MSFLFRQPSTIRALTLAAAIGITYLARYTKSKKYKHQLPVLKNEVVKNRSILGLSLNEKEYVALLNEMMTHVEHLQNSPPKLVPREDLVADIVIKYLSPYTIENGGVLQVRKITYVEGRSNVIITYPGTSDKVVSFVGSHMDVVPAVAADWKRDPFKLTVEDDTLYGRGVTDCLGHVALITQILKQLAQLKPTLKVGVAAVFIADEENGSAHAGIDKLEAAGELQFLKKAPLFWVDSANIGPTIGTGGVAVWELTAVGKGFHSGLPHMAINPISLAHEAVQYIQKRFYRDFVFSAEAEAYKFAIGSTFKPTQTHCPPGSHNQIPRTCTISGDIRFIPFDPWTKVKEKVEGYVRDLNETIIKKNRLFTTGYDNFVLKNADGSAIQGLIELKWLGEPGRGVACDLESLGYKSICDAVHDVFGEVKPFSLTGTLPIIADLKDAGFDVQVCGFGRMDAYHAVDEYAKLSEFVNGAKVIANIIASLDAHL